MSAYPQGPCRRTCACDGYRNALPSFSVGTVLEKLLVQEAGAFDRRRGDSVEMLVGPPVELVQFCPFRGRRRAGDVLVDEFATPILHFCRPHSVRGRVGFF